MGILRGVYDLHKEGNRDAQRHQEKLKDAFKKNLHDIISEEDIITSDGNKKVKVPIRALDQYRFVFDKDKYPGTGQGDGNTKEGDILQRKDKGENHKAGDQPGEIIYEAEIDLDDLVDMMLEDLALPRLDPKKKADLTVPEVYWNDISKKGSLPNMHKKRTIIENIKRNAQETGKAKFGGVKQSDIRYKTWNEELKPVTSAVVFAMLDVSGSMDPEKKYIARSFFFWMVQFLKHKYENVDIVFISHTTEAHVTNEHDFFHRAESGGTKVSSAYEKCKELIEVKYDPNLWNIFAFHFSDGETWSDEEKCISLIKEICKVANMFGYGEIDTYNTQAYYASYSHYSTLYNHYEKNIDSDKFVQAMITDKKEIYDVLKKFFAEETDG